MERRRLMGMEGGERGRPQEGYRALCFGRCGARGRPSGRVPHDLAGSAEQSAVDQGLLRLARLTDGARMRGGNFEALVPMHGCDPQQVHLEEQETQRGGNPQKPAMQATGHVGGIVAKVTSLAKRQKDRVRS